MKSYSWHLTESGSLVKELDFSSFHHKETGIPKAFYNFFGIDSSFQSSGIEFRSNNSEIFKIKLFITRPKTPLAKISWGSDFDKYLKAYFKEWAKLQSGDRSSDMKLVLSKKQLGVYLIRLLGSSEQEFTNIEFDKKVSIAFKKKLLSKPRGNIKPLITEQVSKSIQRDPHVKAWVLKNSAGVCESCNVRSPFKKDDGAYYLEVHHLTRLADGGPDIISNAIAVCPNCHRYLHLGEGREQAKESIVNRISRLKSY